MSILEPVRDMLGSPESQKDPHYWAATFGGHAHIALLPWGIVALWFDMWTAAWVIPVLYFFVWEGMQFILSEKKTKDMAWDGVLDSVAVAFGCYAAACLGNGMQLEAVFCWAASIGVMATGWRVRE